MQSPDFSRLQEQYERNKEREYEKSLIDWDDDCEDEVDFSIPIQNNDIDLPEIEIE